MFHITEKNLSTMPRSEGPSVNYSVFEKLDTPLPVRGFSIKLGVKGIETYRVNGSAMPVNAGEYLLVNRFSDTRVLIDSVTPVEGFCLELTSGLVDQAVASHLDPSGDGLELQRSFLTGEEFFEQVHNIHQTSLGRALSSLAPTSMADARSRPPLMDQHFLVLADALVLDHMPILARLSNMKAVRHGTRKDLLRRIQRARDLIHSDFHKPLSCLTLATVACMSEFHFYRIFRACIGVTPHSYLLDVRIANAQRLMLKGGLSMTEIALLSGFPDIQSFSKVFKRRAGTTPSAFIGRKRRN